RNGASPFLASFFCGATSSNEMFRNYEQARHCGKKNCADSVVTPSIIEPLESESDNAFESAIFPAISGS
ncbi:MAG: hypothetical protein LAT79_14890, partial [Kiritimatiellae bacterium]|nr:hypothetical protein [Kiritimatiellia bacterium]